MQDFNSEIQDQRFAPPLSSLDNKNKKRWYLRWWGILILLIVLIFIIGIVFFVYRVNFYLKAYEEGNLDVFDGQFIDASRYSQVDQVNPLEVATFDDPYWGVADAELVVVEFGDFGCPFCKKNIPDLNRLREKYSDKIKFIYRDFPVTYIHPQAHIAAEAAECADDQGMFWPYHDLLFERQGQYQDKQDLISFASFLGLDVGQFSDCLNSGKYQSEVANDLQEGIRLGVKGTPTFFIDGVKLSGVLSFETFSQIIEQKLKSL